MTPEEKTVLIAIVFVAGLLLGTCLVHLMQSYEKARKHEREEKERELRSIIREEVKRETLPRFDILSAAIIELQDARRRGEQEIAAPDNPAHLQAAKKIK